MRTLAAGCSVLIEGALIKVADRTEAVELASCLGVSVLRFWAGTLPPNLDARLWHPLDADPDALAALTTEGRFRAFLVRSLSSVTSSSMVRKCAAAERMRHP